MGGRTCDRCRPTAPVAAWAGLALVLALLPACASSSHPAKATVTTLAGTGVAGSAGDGGIATAAQLDRPSGLAVDGAGNLYVADQAAHRVRRIDRRGRITTVAGTGTAGFAGDGGPAVQAELAEPAGLAFDDRGRLLIADAGNGRIRSLDRNGRISTLAGNGRRGYAGDGGAAVATSLNNPSAVAVDSQGRVFIADTGNGRIRVVEGGTITTAVGGGRAAPADGLAATDVDLEAPSSVAVDPAGGIDVALPRADRLIRVGPDAKLHVITTGERAQPYGDGRPDRLGVIEPTGVAVDGHGNVFVTEAGEGRVRRVDGRGRVFTVVEGAPPGRAAPAGDPVEAAALTQPGAIVTTRAGEVIVADPAGHRVRRVRKGAGGRLEPRPLVTGLSPSTGGASGQTAVAVTGRDFSRIGTTVTIGGAPAAVLGAVLGAQEDRLVVASPGGRAGTTVDVVVTTQSGPSKTSAATRFTYTDGWQRAADLGSARLEHSATLLDPPACRRPDPPPAYPCGQVLVVGGIEPPPSGARFVDNQLQVFAGTLASSELYDPGANTWRARAPLPGGPRREATATLLADGTVLVAGGIGAIPGDVASAVRYDPVADVWAPAAPLAEARFDHTATLLDAPACAGTDRAAWCGRVLVTGGATGGTVADFPISSAELFDPARGTWMPAGRMAVARTEHTATLLADGRVLVAGGASPPGPDATTVAAGATAEIYDPNTNSWSPAGAMGVARFDHSATRLRDGRVLVVGGASSAEPYRFTQSAELFDPATAAWRPAAIPAAARGAHSATLLRDGRVVVAGGGPFLVEPMQTARPDAVASVEVYDPSTDTWSPTRILNTARSRHTATLLDGPPCRAQSPPAYCGGVLVAGGGGSTPNPDPFALATPLASTELYRPSAPPARRREIRRDGGCHSCRGR